MQLTARGQVAFSFLRDDAAGPVHVAAGILEIPMTDAQGDHLMVVRRDSGGFCDSLVLEPAPENMALLIDEPGAFELGELAMSDIWRLPEEEGGLLLCRKTRMPARPGCVVLAFAGRIRLDSREAEEGIVYELASIPTSTGLTGLVSGLFREEDELLEIEDGSELLHLPVWGWGRDPVGFVTTLDAGVIEDCRELAWLRRMDPRILDASPGLRRRYERLAAGTAGRASGTRSRFEAAIAERLAALDIDDDMLPVMDGVRSKADLARHRRMVSQLAERVVCMQSLEEIAG